MESCGQFQAQMLDHLYDLLDAHEQQALLRHLEECPSCAAALKGASKQQEMFAAAARMEFPQVRFAPPSNTLSPATEAPAVAPLPRRRPALGVLALAASLLLVFGVAGIFGARLWNGYRQQQVAARQAQADRSDAIDRAEELARRHETSMAALRDETAKLQRDWIAIPAEQQKELEKVAQEANARQLNVLVLGNEVMQPGRRNDYTIVTTDLNGQPVASKVEARLVNQDKKLVATPAVETTAKKGEFKLSLAPDVPLYPNQHLTLEVVAHREDGAKVPVSGPVEVAGKPMYFTHLATDKPLYQLGETVHFRSLTLERSTMKPPSEDLQIVFSITDNSQAHAEFYNSGPRLATLADENGKMVLGPDHNPIRGIGVGEFAIDPVNFAGGEYTLSVREINDRFQPQVRKFRISKYEPPRLNKELDFGQKSYGPGQEVTATASAARVEGDRAKLSGKPAIVTIKVDDRWYDLAGKEYAAEQKTLLTTDKDGVVKLRFKLPARIERGDANLSVVFDDGGSPESITKPIPVVLKKLNVEFFPEGGDLVAGLTNRVYFQVRSTLDKPADLRGSIVYGEGDQEKVEVADVRTLHDESKDLRGYNLGMGAFTFTPVAGRKYRLKVEEPIGIESQPELPAVKDSGVVMSIPAGVVGDKESIKVTLRSTAADRSFWVGAYCRGRLVDQQPVALKESKEGSVALKPAQGTGGVCRVTVFEEKKGEGDRVTLVPVAERLVYRTPVERLNLTVTPQQPRYSPADKVDLQVQATDENKESASAIVLLYVVDKRTLTLADEKTARSMPTQFFLAPEVRAPEDLEYADFLLNDDPKLRDKSREALDLLLGTQGWRRFAEQNPDEFRKKNPGKENQDVQRLLVLNGQSAGNKQIFDLRQDEVQAVVARHQARAETLQALIVEKDAKAASEAQTAQQDREAQAGLAAAAGDRYRAAASQLESYEATFAELRQIVLPLLVVLLAVFGVVSLAIAMARSISLAVPYYVATAVCFLVLLGLSGFFIWQHAQYQQIAQVDSATARNQDARLSVESKRALPHAPPGMDMGAANLDADEFLGLRPEDAEGKALGGAGFGRGGQAFPANVPGAAPPLAKLADGAGMDKDAKGEGKDRLDDMKKAGDWHARRDLKAAQKEKGANAAAKMDRAQIAANQLAEMPREREQMALRKIQPGGRAGPALGQRMPPFAGALAPAVAPRFEPFFVREFAFKGRERDKNEPRRDFDETLYWHPALVLADGKSLSVHFDLCDSVTTFQVVAFGHTVDGRLGAATTTIESSLPFVVEPKLPFEVTAGDKIGVAVKVANSTPLKREVNIQVDPDGLQLIEGGPQQKLEVPENGSARKVFRFQPSMVEGDAVLNIIGECSPFARDSIRRTLKVVPDGFPVVQSKSDMLESQAMTTAVLPESWIKGTLRCQVDVYPSTLADLQKGLESLLREPNGCFEQTSTSNYPNLLILDYLRESNQNNPELEKKARDLLERGYQKLTGFECQPPGSKKQGYEWFGGASPAHEALTAYGLLEFRDMARVTKVDPDMLQRTRAYLMGQKDGKGGFKRNALALDSFGRAPDNITNAYIVWSLTEGGQDDDVDKELAALNEQAKSSKDAYFIALVANGLLNRSKTKEGQELLTKLAELQKEDGHLVSASTSITCSGGRDLEIETTALSVLAWLKRPEFNASAQKAIRWIGQQRGGFGGFGSTQSTILALKAIIAYTKANKKTTEAGTLSLFVNEQRVGSLDFAAGTPDVLSLSVPEPEKYLKPGENKIRTEITGSNSFPATVSWSYRTVKPVSAEGCPLRLTTKVDRTVAEEGDTASLTVTIENTGKEDANMPVAIIGLPGGMTLPEDLKQFEALTQPRDNGARPGLIASYELRSNNRELVLYWRGLSAGQKVDVPLQVFCRVPGEYRGPASRAYLYYNADKKCWIDPIAIEIKAKE
jgi:uncharacterized repeat protein (TIGR01451 family)